MSSLTEEEKQQAGELIRSFLLDKGIIKTVSTEDALRSEVARLTAEVERLREADRWIPVGEKEIPDKDGRYLIAYQYKNGDRFVREAHVYQGKWDFNFDFQEAITHWRPLPPPPQEQGGDR